MSHLHASDVYVDPVSDEDLIAAKDALVKHGFGKLTVDISHHAIVQMDETKRRRPMKKKTEGRP